MVASRPLQRRILSWLPIVVAAIALGMPTRGLGETPAGAVLITRNSSAAPGYPPKQWLPSKGRECIRRGRYRGFCQGPRQVPAPHGPAAALAEKLGLGDQKMVSHLMLKAPHPEWSEAAQDVGDASAEELLWPVVGGKLWRGFGRVKRGPKRSRRHKGVDIGAPVGTLIRAAKSGLVAYSDNGIRGYGNLLVMVHADASVTFYAHCRATYVFPGQSVTRGQIVGEVGHTGIARGPHLHFEYRERGYLRDPLKRFVERPE